MIASVKITAPTLPRFGGETAAGRERGIAVVLKFMIGKMTGGIGAAPARDPTVGMTEETAVGPGPGVTAGEVAPEPGTPRTEAAHRAPGQNVGTAPARA